MYFGLPRRLPYVASKAAVGGLTATLAAEWAVYGVRVHAIAPGFIETPLAAEAFRRGHVDRSKAEAAHAMARMGQPTEVASAARFLLSDEASFITGEVLVVDGGLRIKYLR